VAVRGRQFFRWLTIALFVLTAWTAYANVFTDDSAVRAKARAAMGELAGCGDTCKVEQLRGERGMFGESIEYDVVLKGHVSVMCRREYVSFGDWRCVASK
jgi:hypothetical protein